MEEKGEETVTFKITGKQKDIEAYLNIVFEALTIHPFDELNIEVEGIEFNEKERTACHNNNRNACHS